jgi:hypothetical protein
VQSLLPGEFDEKRQSEEKLTMNKMSFIIRLEGVKLSLTLIPLNISPLDLRMMLECCVNEE